ncbi:hypothetical protein KUW18_09110 [Halomonas sp. DP5Y7-2]|uniref:hypothetical protein n=1 Tax=Halomonas sp. DP5Y7-2 TaxID=2859076 RepID=UPI001C99AD97|nr:hypothetical protein [Halomonas sp. DP5Y7-2]MBY5984249.1 hypothetical protein [Halomonas sp. DP5Y7-2]
MSQGNSSQEPDFHGNTGNGATTQQPCGLQALPIDKRGGNNGNTSLSIPIPLPISVADSKTPATGCHFQSIENKAFYLCCHVATNFQNQTEEYKEGATQSIGIRNSVPLGGHAPSLAGESSVLCQGTPLSVSSYAGNH